MKNVEEFEVGIVGKGKMGTNLFFYFLDFDFPLKWICRNKDEVTYLTDQVQKKLSRSVRLELIDNELYQKRLEQVQVSNRLDELSNCDLVIETISEELQKKQVLFKKLDDKVRENCVLTSNSSSFLPTEWYKGGKNPDRIAGLHFFFPVTVKNIVEIITTDRTARKVIDTIQYFLSIINRKSFILTEESAFLLNRLFLDFQAGAYRILLEYDLSYAELDEIVKEEFFPVGVFEFFDHVGNDIMYNSITGYCSRVKNPEFYKPLLKQLKELVREKKLGIKTKCGFYSYSGRSMNEVTDSRKATLSPGDKRSIIGRLRKWYLDSATLFVSKGYCTRNEMNYAVKEYMNCEKGPFEFS
ncbi:MAG: 3-hydroxyacyl-CoA dehydrogenase family protein [Bacteroidales bacterium]|nr:MAG: 3-hydroxyacyl-CoA dehydrogenase family protein [Bacteroidales bacterium]